MLTMLTLGLLFLIITILLYRSKQERHLGFVFLIRSNFGLKIIDRLAKFKPGLWNFLADFSVLIFFGAVGGYYLGRFKETRRNLSIGLSITCLIGLVVGIISGLEIARLFGVSILLLFFAKKIKNQKPSIVDFIITGVIIGLSFSIILSGLSKLIIGESQIAPLSVVLYAIFGVPAVLTYSLIFNGMQIIQGRSDIPGVSPMVPSVDDTGTVGVGFPGIDLFIPWWYALIALSVTLLVHEGAHGVLSRVAKVKVKSTGLLSFGALPIGAFVEPDEEKLKEKTSVQRMRVFTVGSFANMIAGLVAVGIIFTMLQATPSLLEYDGMLVTGTVENFPANKILPENVVIKEINGQSVQNIKLFNQVVSSIKPGDEIVLNTDKGEFKLEAAVNPDNPEKGYIGIYLIENVKFKGPSPEKAVSLLGFIISSCIWVAFFNFAIAMVNLLPVIPFDGGRMFKEFVEIFNFKQITVEKILYSVIATTAIIFILNMIPLFRMLKDFLIGLI